MSIVKLQKSDKEHGSSNYYLTVPSHIVKLLDLRKGMRFEVKFDPVKKHITYRKK